MKLIEFDRYSEWKGGPDGKVAVAPEMVLSVVEYHPHPPKVEIQIIGGVRSVLVAEPYETVMRKLRAAEVAP